MGGGEGEEGEEENTISKGSLGTPIPPQNCPKPHIPVAVRGGLAKVSATPGPRSHGWPNPGRSETTSGIRSRGRLDMICIPLQLPLFFEWLMKRTMMSHEFQSVETGN